MTKEELRAKEELREVIHGECIKDDRENGNPNGCNQECDNDCFFYAERIENKIIEKDKRIKELEEENKTLKDGSSILSSKEKTLVEIECPDCKGECKVNAGDSEEPDLIECPVCNGKGNINRRLHE